MLYILPLDMIPLGNDSQKDDPLFIALMVVAVLLVATLIVVIIKRKK